MTPLIGVILAGAVGAPARFLLDQWIGARGRGPFPLGTFVVNVTGAFLLGLITGLALYRGLGSLPKVVLGTGFCGAFTTFSTFSYETVRLLEEGTIRAAAANVIGSLALGLLAAGAGLALAAAI